MKKNSREKSLKNYLVLALLVYLVAGLLLIKYYRYQINPDGISYISIAQKYLNGDFSNALNGYWGPLLSWLLVPFLHLTSDSLLAAKLLTLLTGLVTIIALRALSYRFEMTESIRTVILFSAVPVVLTFAFSDITPDLLLTCILLFYFTVIFGVNYAESTNKDILCGVLGGLAYLSKSFAFPFFIVHFSIMNALVYYRSQTKQARKRVVRNFLTGTVAFALISGLWIGLISNKYGRLTFGVSGKTTYKAYAGPDAPRSGVRLGFLRPSNETAVSAWEDPSFLEYPPYNPLESWSNFVHQLKVVGGNIHKTAGIFMVFSLLSIVTGIAYLLFWLRRFNIAKMPAEVLYPTVTIILFVGGYSMVLVEARYIWVLFILLMLMGGYVLARLFQNNFFTKTRRVILLVIFFLSFAVPASHGLRNYAHRGKWVYNLGQALKNVIPAKSKTVSNSNWAGALFLSYHLDCKYYGTQKKNISKIELKRQLAKYNIDYYLFWGGAAADLGFLSNYEEITGGRIPGLRIYGLKNRR